MLHLHPQQFRVNTEIRALHAGGARNVLAVSPTGSGKTVMMADHNLQHPGASLNIAHRQELVGQMSLALARNAVSHRVIGGPGLIRQLVSIHMAEVGRSYFDPMARCGVAGVDTLIKRGEFCKATGKLLKLPDDPWFRQVTLWQTDEAHHLLAENKWGKATLLFPNALGIGWTATPARADGYGLGREADGVFDAMVVGEDMRWHINNGFLTDYRIFAPPSDVDLSEVTITAGGDFSPPKLRKAVHESHIVGDVVKHYLRIAPGKLGVTFAVDIEEATKIAAAFRLAGVPAEVVTSDTPDIARAAILRRFRNREILQLVNVDLFGEGFDLPAIEVVSMARPTASFTLYAQQFGRALRLMLAPEVFARWNDLQPHERLAAIAASGKPAGIIIDHVSNVERHNGPPDRRREWSLARRPRRSAHSGLIGVVPPTTCQECTASYDRTKKACPFCGHVNEPASRSTPAAVDGDLVELDPAVLAAMRGDIERFDLGPEFYPTAPGAANAVHQNFVERTRAQKALRATMELWAGYRKAMGDTDSESLRRFFFEFRSDWLSVMMLPAREADELQRIISGELAKAGVVAA